MLKKKLVRLCGSLLVSLLFFTGPATAQGCSGSSLNGGTLTASPGALCPFAIFNISVSGSTTGAGLSYQWQSSPDNSTWKDLRGFTGETLNTSQSATSWYRRRIQCEGGATAYSNSIQVVATDFHTCYCTPSSSNCTTGFSITRVVFGSLDNSSTCSTGGYTNYTATVPATDLMQGALRPVSITVGAGNVTRSVHCYIDFNQNGQFEPKEYTPLRTPVGNVYSGLVRVPFTAKLGLTRMRIIVNGGSSSTCSQSTFSETEDYAINMTPNTTSATGHVIYVKNTAQGSSQTGFSWANALTSLREAIYMAFPGDTVKVAAGTYYSGTYQTNGISLADSIFLMGGYPATGSPTNADRNVGTHPTVLSGYQNANRADRDYHVLFASKISACTVDGFIIQDGGNHFGSEGQDRGGGISIEQWADVTIRNCVFRSSGPVNKGAAIAVTNSAASFSNCIVEQNNGYYSNILVQQGSTVNFTNLLAARNGNGSLLEIDSSSVVVKNSTLANNTSTQYFARASRRSEVDFTNSILYYNGIYSSTWQNTTYDSAEVKLHSSTARFRHSLMQVNKEGPGLILGATPKFQDTSSVAGKDGFFFTADDGYALINPCSPALNAGLNSEATAIPTDILGLPRIASGRVDMGAYEIQQNRGIIPSVIYVNASATGANNGTSWADAYTDLHKALQACSDTIKVAAGTYTPWKSSLTQAPYWLENNRVIMGAYPPSGNPANSQRDFKRYPTTISGLMQSGDRAITVARGLNLDSTSVVDGLTFTQTGREVWTEDATVVYTYCNNPVISHCNFTDNKRRVFFGLHNNNPRFLECNVLANNGLAQSYGLDLVVLKNSLRTTFKNCRFSNNILITGNSTVGEFGKILLLEKTDALFDSCVFLRNQGTILVNNHSKPQITNSIFLNNYAGQWSSGVRNRFSDPTFRKCLFVDSAWQYRFADYGGIMNNYISNPSFTDCHFYNGKTSRYGGVAYNDSSNARFNNCVFANSTNTFYNVNSSHIELTNCIATDNTNLSDAAAFMHNVRSSPSITNTVVVNSSAYSAGLLVNTAGSHPKIHNSIFWRNFQKDLNMAIDLAARPEIINTGGSVPLFRHTMLEVYDAGVTGGNTTGVNPRFKNFSHPIGPDSTWFTEDDGLRLCDCSPAINSGNNNLLQVATDIANQPRVFGLAVDRGAYELQQAPGAPVNTAYVKENGAGSANGTSWANAYTSLHPALADPCIDTVKIAAGLYKPATQFRDSAFYINRNLTLLGSYDATGSARNADLHPTILSGDIGIANETSDNSFGLLRAWYFDSLIVDGIVFRDINQNINGASQNNRALEAHFINYVSITNSRFYNNHSNYYGGALFLMQVKDFQIRKSVFSGNKAERGAGLYINYNGLSHRVIDCVFDQNEATYQGGGVWTGQSGTSFINCLFTGNRAREGGGLFLNNNPDVLVTNCTFSNNLLTGGTYGAGIYSSGYAFQGGGAGPHIGNSLFTGNTTLGNAGKGQGLFQDIYYPKNGYVPNGTLDLRIHHSAVTSGPTYFWGGGLISPGSITYRNEKNPAGPDGRWGTGDDGLQLSPCSGGGINQGLNARVSVSADLAGSARIVGAAVDMGAYEFSGRPEGAGMVNTAKDSLSANKEFTDSTTGWTHYYKDCLYLLSLQKGGRNIGTVGDGTFRLTVVTTPAYSSGKGVNLTTALYNTGGKDWFAMNRYWKVTPTHPVTDSILVRFPYATADFRDIRGSLPSVYRHDQLRIFMARGETTPYSLSLPAGQMDRYQNGDAPSRSFWRYLKQDSIHVAEYYVAGFDGSSTAGAFPNETEVPDLSLSSFSLPATSAASGTSVNATFNVANLSPYRIGAHQVHFYLSADTLLTPGTGGDTLLASFSVASLAATASTGNLLQPVRIPCTVAPGNYTLFCVADGDSDVPESNEDNNTRFLPLKVSEGIGMPKVTPLTVTPKDTVCGGTVVTITANTASCIDCTYSWNNNSSGPSISVMNGGTYTVTASNACGTTTASQVIRVNPPLIMSVTSNRLTVCSGDSLLLTATGASTYTWSGSGLTTTSGSSVIARPLTPGTASYTVTGTTTNGCTATKTLSVTVDPLPAVTIASADTVICLGGAAVLSASGADSYDWTPSSGLNTNQGATVIASPATTTTYTVRGYRWACKATASKTVNVVTSVTPTLTIAYTGCGSESLTFTATASGGGNSSKIVWFVNGSQQGTGATFHLPATSNGAQVYARMTSSLSCASPSLVTSATITVNCTTTAVPLIDGLESFTLSPNPSNGFLTLRFKLRGFKTVSFQVLNALGTVVAERAPESFSGTTVKQINLEHIPAGTYYLRVVIGNRSFVKQVVLAR